MENEIRKNTESDEFLKLLVANQTRIYAYILGLISNYNDADDIMQETISLLWRNFSKFKPGTDFVAWGIKVAHYKILNFRQTQQKMNKRVVFDDDVLDMITSKTERSYNNFEQLNLLQDCVKKLSDRDFNFLKLRYYEAIKPGEMSTRLGMSIQNVYKSLARMHGRLLKCVKFNIKGTVS